MPHIHTAATLQYPQSARLQQLGRCDAQVMDMLVEQTHEVRHEWRNNERPMRYTDTRLDEQQRAVSLKMVPMSLLLEASTGKSFLMNLIDAPGELVPAQW